MPFDGTWLDPVVQTLLGAEDILMRRGWIKGCYGSSGGPRCVAGAIAEASRSVATSLSVNYDDLRYGAGHVYAIAVAVDNIAVWQDQPTRTIEEIREGFSLAIARAIEQRVAA